jgi:hypothetical protein
MGISFPLLALWAATVAIAFLHALAPDHWAPLVMMSKAQRWRRRKLALMTFLSGTGHVGSSALIAVVGATLGLTLLQVQALETSRAEVAVFLLMGFGLAYALWSLKRAKSRRLSESNPQQVALTWTLVAIIVFGPCEPLIPLLFIATIYDWFIALSIAITFGVVTISTMLLEVLLAHAGLMKLRSAFWERYDHTVSGLAIAATGLVVLILQL